MFTTLKFAVAALALSATSALAAGEPWTKSAPRNMTEAHQQYAAAARNVHAQVGNARFGYNPLQANWRFQGDRNYTLPLSNMTKAALSSAVNGRYQVYSAIGQSDWSVRYYGTNGKIYFCESNGRGRYKEWTLDRYIHTTSFGLAGVMGWDPRKERTATPPSSEQVGWPTIANPSTGEFVTYNWRRGNWHAESGWLQNEYAAVFAEKCPNLPRTSAVNNNQSGSSLRDIAQGARGIRSFDVAFPNDPRNPLTAGMYYHLYPPVSR